MVKWIAAIEFVHDFADLGAGQGGYKEVVPISGTEWRLG
jgi:hypothetical protein